jgi:hypothetical protein
MNIKPKAPLAAVDDPDNPDQFFAKARVFDPSFVNQSRIVSAVT